MEQKKPILDYAINEPPLRQRLVVIDWVLVCIALAVLLFAAIFVLCLV
jgi:hypothetical protein